MHNQEVQNMVRLLEEVASRNRMHAMKHDPYMALPRWAKLPARLLGIYISIKMFIILFMQAPIVASL